MPSHSRFAQYVNESRRSPAQNRNRRKRMDSETRRSLKQSSNLFLLQQALNDLNFYISEFEEWCKNHDWSHKEEVLEKLRANWTLMEVTLEPAKRVDSRSVAKVDKAIATVKKQLTELFALVKNAKRDEELSTSLSNTLQLQK